MKRIVNGELKEYITLSLVILFMCGLAYFDYVRGHKIFLINSTDALNTMLKHYMAMHHMIYDGESFFYTFNKGLGSVIGIGNPNYYGDIFAWIIALLPIDLLPYGLIYIHILKCIVAGCFFYAFLSEFALKNESKFLGALMYVFCGHMICRSPWMHYMTEMCFMALFLWGLEKWHKNHHSLAASICLGFFLVSRFATYAYVDTIYAFAYIVIREKYDNAQSSLRSTLSEIKDFLPKYLLGLGGGAVSVLPGALLFFNSSRKSGSIWEKIIGNLTLESPMFMAQEFIKTLMPHINGMFHVPVSPPFDNVLEFPCFYTGLIAFLLVIQILGNEHISFRKRRIFYFLLGAICVYAVSPLAKSFFNGFIVIHVKTASLWINVILAVLAVYVFDRQCIDKKRLLISAGAILLAAATVFNYMIYIDAKLIKREVLMVVLLLPFYAYMLVSKVKDKYVLSLCIAEFVACTYFSTLVPVQECGQYIVTFADYQEYTYRYDFLEQADNSSGDFFRIGVNERIPQYFNDSLVRMYRPITLYDGLVNKNLLEMIDYFQIQHPHINIIQGIGDYPGLCDLLSVKYYVEPGRAELVENKNWHPFGYLYEYKVLQNNIKAENSVIKGEIARVAAIVEETNVLPDLEYTIDSDLVGFKEGVLGLNDMRARQTDDTLTYEVIGGDPIVIRSLAHPVKGSLIVDVKISGAIGENGQIFYRSLGTEFSEEKSKVFTIDKDGWYHINIVAPEGAPISDLRFDVGKPGGEITLELPGIRQPSFTVTQEPRHDESICLDEFSDTYIKGHAMLTEPRIAFFSIPYENGWKIFDNGKEVEKLKVNVGFMGIFLEPGEHQIELKYRLPGLYEGGVISLLSLGWLFICWRRNRFSR